MKAIILAAGEGTRLKPITNTLPKALIKIYGKSLLEYNIESIYSYVSEIIIIVKYLGEIIIEEIGNEYKGVKISYHKQGNEKGTGAALKGIHLDEDTIIMYADSICDSSDIERLVHSSYYGCLVQEVENPKKYGIFKSDSHGFAKEIKEKPQQHYGNLANLGYYKFNKDIFQYIEQIPLSERGEYELTCAINAFIKSNKFFLTKIEGKFIDITTPIDIAEANISFARREKPQFGKAFFLEQIKDLSLYVGIPEEQINNIIQYSQNTNDSALLKNTGDKERFSEYEKFHSWYQDKGRYVFSLLDEEKNIIGIWFGRPSKLPTIQERINPILCNRLLENPQNIHTSGIRIYPQFRGKGFAGPLLEKSGYYYRKIFQNAYMCIDIDAENIPSQKIYEKCGYILIGKGENKKTITANTKARLVYLELPK